VQAHESQSGTFSAALHLYNNLQDKWKNTLPLRGQKPKNPGDPKPDIRPIGRRSRKHEVVERIDLEDGTYAYAATLYQTRCVIAYPDGTFTVSTGGWDTPSTAKFICTHTPQFVACVKVRNNLWLYGRDSTTGKNPIKHRLGQEPTRFYVDASRDYGALVCVDPKPIKVERVDRKKTRPYHDKLRPFMDWMSATLTMSDEWLMHETRKAVLGIHSYSETNPDGSITIVPSGNYANPNLSPSGNSVPRELYQWGSGGYGPNSMASRVAFEWFSDLHEREDDWLFALCILSLRYRGYDHAADVSRLAESHTRMVNGRNWPVKYYDLRLSFKALKRFVYELIASAPDNVKIVERQATDQFLNNVVG
jgi:hypothetical protein